MITEIEKKLKAYISKKELLQEGDTVLVGVSGGVDSMVLIDFLYTYQDFYRIHLKVAHINHGIREEAARDEQHVSKWCEERGIPCAIHRCDVKAIAKAKHLSEEEVGRDERYSFFISLTNPDDKIATAHNMNDQTETMLMHFIRGADVKGLGGISAQRDNIIRPILCLTKQEIRAYAEAKHIAFHEDHTNFLPIYSRNKMRLECVPYIQTHFNTNIHETLFRQGELYQEATLFIEAYTNQVEATCIEGKDKCWHIRIPILQQEKVYIQKKVIYNMLVRAAGAQKDLTQSHVQSCLELMTMQTGKTINLPYEMTVKRQYDNLIFEIGKQEEINTYDYLLTVGTNTLEALCLQLELTPCNRKTFEESKENMYTKYVDYDKIKDNLHLRTRKPCDYITLKGGKKKLKKFFIDEKMPKERRDCVPLLTDEQEVIWVVGSRLNSKYFVTTETTRILEIKITKQNAQEGLC